MKAVQEGKNSEPVAITTVEQVHPTVQIERNTWYDEEISRRALAARYIQTPNGRCLTWLPMDRRGKIYPPEERTITQCEGHGGDKALPEEFAVAAQHMGW